MISDLRVVQKKKKVCGYRADNSGRFIYDEPEEVTSWKLQAKKSVTMPNSSDRGIQQYDYWDDVPIIVEWE